MKTTPLSLARSLVLVAVGLAVTMAPSAAAQSTTQADIDQLQQSITTCRTGLNALLANLYRYPERPDTASGGKRAWTDVYGEFKSNQLPACYKVGSFIEQRSGQPIVKAVEAGIAADGVQSYQEYFSGRNGVVAQGDRIPAYCPNLHRSQFDCVSASQRIGDISTPQILDKLDRLAALDCVPEQGWSGCAKIDGISGVDFRIYSTAQVSVSAQKLVESTYAKILSILKPAYPASKFNGFKVYITNGEPWTELTGLYPVGAMANGDETRGGANGDLAWVSEQMICKTGVKTRNDAFAAGTRAKGDDGARTRDQVVHEFAHSIDFKYNLEAAYGSSIFAGTPPDFPAVEAWAWGVQHFFRVPTGDLSQAQLDFLNGVFSERPDFSDCSGYKPE